MMYRIYRMSGDGILQYKGTKKQNRLCLWKVLIKHGNPCYGDKLSPQRWQYPNFQNIKMFLGPPGKQASKS